MKRGEAPFILCLNFGAAVLGNTIGFGALLAGCWFSLQVMQEFII